MNILSKFLIGTNLVLLLLCALLIFRGLSTVPASHDHTEMETRLLTALESKIEASVLSQLKAITRKQTSDIGEENNATVGATQASNPPSQLIEPTDETLVQEPFVTTVLPPEEVVEKRVVDQSLVEEHQQEANKYRLMLGRLKAVDENSQAKPAKSNSVPVEPKINQSNS